MSSDLVKSAGSQEDVDGAAVALRRLSRHRDYGEGLFAVQGIYEGQRLSLGSDLSMDLCPVPLFNLPLPEKIGQGGGPLSGMGKQDQPEGLAVQTVDQPYLFTVFEKNLGASGERTVVARAAALGQEVGWFIPDTVVFFLGDEPWRGGRQGEDLRIIIQVHLVSGQKGRGRLANPPLLLTWSLEPYRTLGHGILYPAFGKSRGRSQKIAGGLGL